MKIDQISIRRFGHWKDVSLPLTGSDLHVLHGPNEAGKSTLLRFLRGVLYGFKQEPATRATSAMRHGADSSHAPLVEGSLLVHQEGRAWTITRQQTNDERSVTALAHRGSLIVRSAEGDHFSPSEPADWLDQARGGIAEAVYEHVFAVGLQELQELGTLHGDEVAREIYGASLGPEGMRLLHASDRNEACRNELRDAHGRGLLAELAEREQGVQQELQRFEQDRDRYDDLRRERDELEQRVEQLKSDQVEWQRQFRGLDLLSKAWEPWRQVESLRQEMRRLPKGRRFPENGLERLRQLDGKIESQRRERDRLRREAIDLRKKLPKSEIRLDELRPRVESLRDDRDWMARRSADRAAAETEEKRLKLALNKQIAELGAGWSTSRLETFDVSPEGQGEFFKAVRGYERAAARRNRLRRRLKGWSRTCRLQAAEVSEEMKRWGATDLGRSVSEARSRLGVLEQRVELEERLIEQERRESDVRGHLRSLESRLVYPDWLPLLLWFFALGGIAAAGLGFYQGFQQNGMAGLMWLLLGMTSGGLAWGVKSHYEIAVQETAEPMQVKRRSVESELQSIERSIELLQRSSPWLKSALSAEDETRGERNWAARTAEERQRLNRLEDLAARQQKILARRKRLSGLRQTFQNAHRDVTSTRQHFSDRLKRAGLPDTMRAAEALSAWQRVFQTRRQWLEWQQAHQAASERQEWNERFDRRVDEAARQVSLTPPQGKSANEKLAWLESHATGWVKSSAEQAQRLAEARATHRAWKAMSAEVRKLRKERSALLKAAGARSKKEFERRANSIVRRQELSDLLEIAESELQSVAADETELAIVEDDLRRYSPETHESRKVALQRSLEEVELELEHAWERLGSVKQEMKSLENDHRAADLRTQLGQIQRERRAATEEWCALQTASSALERLRSRYERNCQPAALAAASQWLDRLTRGRYRSIWTPLGQRTLRVEDGNGRTFSVDQLSSGTREQLFLAVRLALVKQMRDQGVDLPMVLDDVLVNFDQERTEAAIDTLREFAATGQQVLLFTCHRHVAELAAGRGADSIPLPIVARPAEEEFRVAERSDERRAG